MRKRLVGVVAVLLSSIVAFGASPADAGSAPPAAPRAGRVVPGQFIVTLQPGADARQVAAEYGRKGAAVEHVYSAALSGFAGRMSDSVVAGARRDGRVLRVEQDRVVVADESTQSRATWGLDRLDERPLALDGTYTYATTAPTVTAYILDTGIRATHADLLGRVSGGYTAIADGGGTNDCNGHGTHVAGTVGGTTWGVAKGVKLVPVRVLGCDGSGTWSGVIAGIDWVTANAVKPAVANMSLGGGASSSVDDAVRRSIASGVTYALSAGNSNVDACNQSPARVAEAITVAATDKTDTRASYSNFGSCVDIFAPGSSITSSYHSSDTATATMNGTSMAAPHVAGVAALQLAADPAASPLQVRDAMVANATPDVVKTAGTSSPNRLLHARWSSATVLEQPAATTGVVSGIISSSAGSTLAGATVSAGGASTTTDANGAYSLTLAAGTYTVSASASGHVTTSASASVTAGATTIVSLTLTKQTTSGIALSARPYKVRGFQHVDLTWSGTTSGADVWRGSQKFGSLSANTNAFTDRIGQKGSGTYTYKVCEAGGTTTCSAQVTVTF